MPDEKIQIHGGEKQDHPVDLSMGKKECGPGSVSVNIRHADGHYLASFYHNSPRVFHNIEELLVAIEVEVKRLYDG